MAQVDTLIDFVDDNGDGNINYKEFTKVLVADDIMLVPQPKSLSPNKLWGGRPARLGDVSGSRRREGWMPRGGERTGRGAGVSTNQ